MTNTQNISYNNAVCQEKMLMIIFKFFPLFPGFAAFSPFSPPFFDFAPTPRLTSLKPKHGQKLKDTCKSPLCTTYVAGRSNSQRKKAVKELAIRSTTGELPIGYAFKAVSKLKLESFFNALLRTFAVSPGILYFWQIRA